MKDRLLQKNMQVDIMNKTYEIEKKYLVKKLPEALHSYPHYDIEQGYLCTNPVIRVRKTDADYILTYKSSGMMMREEYEHPLTCDGYNHLIKKADGTVISKTRYLIKGNDRHTIELDIFHKDLKGIVLAEVEFSSLNDAQEYIPPEWFGEEVTDNICFHNSRISRMKADERLAFVAKYAAD